MGFSSPAVFAGGSAFLALVLRLEAHFVGETGFASRVLRGEALGISLWLTLFN